MSNLKTRLISGFAVPITALIVMAIGFEITLTWMDREVSQVNTQIQASFESAIRAQNMRYDAVQVQQWLTDISATRGQDGLDDGFKKAEEYRNAFLSDLLAYRASERIMDGTPEADDLDRMKTAFETYYAEGVTMAKAYMAEGPSAGNKLMSKVDQAADDFEAKMESFVKSHRLQGQQIFLELRGRSHGIRWATLIFAVVLLVVCLPIVSGLVISITRSIHKASEAIHAVAERFALVSQQIASGSHLVAQGAGEQAAALQETSSSLEEMASMTQRNTENSHAATELAKEARSAAEKGEVQMQQMSAAMNAIKASNDEIAEIIKTIDEIAFQTNILALNAAVEAARAGELGLGFAVVADEVRNLAQRSAASARETAAKIEGSLLRTAQGVEISRKVAGELQEIVVKTRKVDELVAAVASASKEQSLGIGQVNQAVGDLDKVTQADAANAEESARASEELNLQVEALRVAVKDLIALVGEQSHASRPEPVLNSNRQTQRSVVANACDK